MPFSSSRHWCTHWLYVACHCRSLFFGKRFFSAVVCQRRCSLHQAPQDTSRHWNLQSSFILLYVHRSHIQLIRDGTGHAGEWGGGRRGVENTYEQPVPAFRPVKTEETVSHRQNNDVKEVGTPPVPSNLCTPQLALSTAVPNGEQSRKDSPKDQLLTNNSATRQSIQL